MMKRYILDSGILIGYARAAKYAREVHEDYKIADPETMIFTSIVNKAEVLALAEKGNWGGKKREIFNSTLNEFTTINIESQLLIEAYTQIKAWTEGSSPPSAPHFPTPQKPAKVMGQNDMWIAATAIITKSTLITTDTDFDHLHDAGIIERIWVNPKG